MSREGLTDWEEHAAAVLAHVGGWTVTVAEDGRTPGQVDLWLLDATGIVGGAEVTALCQPLSLQTIAEAPHHEREVPQARWRWRLRYDAGTDFRDVDKHVVALIEACEAADVIGPHLLPAEVIPEAQDWYRSAPATLKGMPDIQDRRRGVVEIVPNGVGGFIHDTLDPMVEWLDTRIRDEDIDAKIAKLGRVDGQRHLVLLVHGSGMPFEQYGALCFDPIVPTHDLDAPDDLTGLWLIPFVGGAVVWWIRGMGWNRHDYTSLLRSGSD